MLDFTEFGAVFPSEGPGPYSQMGLKQIETYRKSLGGTLFIDRVLDELNIGQGERERARESADGMPTRWNEGPVPSANPPPSSPTTTGNLYPPKGNSGLRDLHRQICDSHVSPHHKLSILYYLLLDYDEIRLSRSNLAVALADESALPQNYQTLMKGLWYMDHKQFNVRDSQHPNHQPPAIHSH